MSTGLWIARIQPPHHWHLDAIQQAFSHGVKKLIIGIGSSDKTHTTDNPFSIDERQYMIEKLLQSQNFLSMTEIYQIPDFPNDTQRTQHVIQTIPDFHHIISDNPRVTDLFPDKKIIIPQQNIAIRASDIRNAIIHQHDHILQQHLSPDIINYLQEINAYDRLKLLEQ